MAKLPKKLTKYGHQGGYGMMECHICHEQISAAGAGRVSHFRSHVRRGEATETKNPETGRLVFTPTNKKPTPKKKCDFRQWGGPLKLKTDTPVITRKLVEARCSPEGISLICRKCGKENEAIVCAADPRFYATICECEALTLFPTRCVKKKGTVMA